MNQEKVKKRAVKQRTHIKGKKPKFRRQESWRYKRVSQVWRRPDGIDSKMRRKVKGWPASAGIGYRGPKMARNLHPSGYEEVVVRNTDDLSGVDPRVQAVRIAHTVGMKKRAEISVRAGERHIRILNPLPREKPEAVEEAVVEKAAKEEEKPKEAEIETEAESRRVEKGSEEMRSGEGSKD